MGLLLPAIPKCLTEKSESLSFHTKATEAGHQIQRQVGNTKDAVNSQCWEN